MIRLIAKVGLIVEFSMSSAQAEADLVRRFNLQDVNPGTVLHLGKFGKIQVSHINSMSIHKPGTIKSVDSSIDDLMNAFSWSNK